jgi:hypothetical protein
VVDDADIATLIAPEYVKPAVQVISPAPPSAPVFVLLVDVDVTTST